MTSDDSRQDVPPGIARILAKLKQPETQRNVLALTTAGLLAGLVAQHFIWKSEATKAIRVAVNSGYEDGEQSTLRALATLDDDELAYELNRGKYKSDYSIADDDDDDAVTRRRHKLLMHPGEDV